jgi:hypothetical protein
MRAFIATMVLAAAALSSFAPVTNAAQTSQCLLDLQSIPDFLAANDPGVRDRLAKMGPRRFEAAFEQAQAEASVAQNEADCDQAITGYLHGYRRGHLSVEGITTTNENSPGTLRLDKVEVPFERAPRLDVSSRTTVVLTIPSFRSRTGRR